MQSINDWILFHLSNEYACEPTNAAETSLYDLTAGDWMYDVIEKLELPKDVFPNVLIQGRRSVSLQSKQPSTPDCAPEPRS